MKSKQPHAEAGTPRMAVVETQSGMGREEALALFGLPEQATRDEVTRRYDIMTRKMKADPHGLEATDMVRIEEAYNLLSGITYRDPEAERRLRERDARPGILARLLHMDQTRLDNLVHYYRWPAIGALAGVAVLIWILGTTVFRPPNDFVMLLAGSIYVEDQDRLEQQVLSVLPDTKNPMLSVVYFDEGTDGQMMSAVTQKLMVEIGYGENDIVIVDRSVYDQYASQGAFLNLDGRLEQFGTSVSEQQGQQLSILPDALAEGEDGLPHVYGIDVTDSRFLREAGVLGTDMIAVFGLNGKHPDKGELVMRVLTEK
jgi:hypothetical protein